MKCTDLLLQPVLEVLFVRDFLEFAFTTVMIEFYPLLLGNAILKTPEKYRNCSLKANVTVLHLFKNKGNVLFLQRGLQIGKTR